MNVGEDVKKRKPFCTVGGTVNWCSHGGKHTWLLHNISVYKSRPWKIKNWDQIRKTGLPLLLSLSNSGWVSIWSAEPTMLTTDLWFARIFFQPVSWAVSISSPSVWRQPQDPSVWGLGGLLGWVPAQPACSVAAGDNGFLPRANPRGRLRSPS